MAWKHAIERFNGPSVLLLSRQNLPVLAHNDKTVQLISRGGYILLDCVEEPDLILIATGSEVQLALAAAKQRQTINIRIVSMPCCEQFLAQDSAYQEKVLPHKLRRRIAIEALATTYWYRFVGLDGLVVGIDQFGLSAPGHIAMHALGMTIDRVLTAIDTLLPQYSTYLDNCVGEM